MRCPECNGASSQVLDTRERDSGSRIMRRRMCGDCGARWTTYEMSDDAFRRFKRTRYEVRKTLQKIERELSA